MDLDDKTRPDYEWTCKQKKSLARFRQLLARTTLSTSNDDEESIEELDRSHLDFLITILNYPLLGSLYDSVLLSALAALGIRKDRGWL